MFFHRRQLRLWAARMLFVWVFGIGAGFANACLSTLPTRHADVHSAHGSEIPVTHHDGAEDTHGSPGSPNCQDFCDRASVSIPTQKAALDDAQAHALIPQVVATAVPVPVFEPVQLRVPRRDGVRAPPILMAFLRLAL
ncbi:MAG TPA: hypothetical protein VN277_00740 [Acidiferrobacterales bacterium]|nr:hypothetical protein [Acidiferrobacterales bacterium]